MFQKQPLVADKRKKEKPKELEKENKPLSLKSIEKFLKRSATYIGAISVKKFKNLLVKNERFSLIVYCNFHWFCLYCTRKTVEIFDPLGFLQKTKCLTNQFFSFLRSHIKGKLVYCNPQIQPNSSNKCGLYVIFFIRMRELGFSFFEILSKFSKNFRKNDIKVKKFVNDMTV